MPIEKFDGGTSITGNAINWFRAQTLLSAMRIYLQTDGKMRATRNATPANMRRWASEYTGKQYPRSRKGLETAAKDLEGLLSDTKPDDVEAGRPI